jgi:hypothetical protein
LALEELQGSFLRLTDLVDHAAAEIEDDADGNGDIFGREIPNLLLDIVFEDTKVIWLKPRNLAVVWIGNGNVDNARSTSICRDWPRLMSWPAVSCFTSL